MILRLSVLIFMMFVFVLIVVVILCGEDLNRGMSLGLLEFFLMMYLEELFVLMDLLVDIMVLVEEEVVDVELVCVFEG